MGVGKCSLSPLLQKGPAQSLSRLICSNVGIENVNLAADFDGEDITANLHISADRVPIDVVPDEIGQWRNIRDRRSTVPLPEVRINGIAVQGEAQAQYRAADGSWSERIWDPEIRYSFKIPNTDLWKSGNVTTGRGFPDR
jgi:hypothetical protein